MSNPVQLGLRKTIFNIPLIWPILALGLGFRLYNLTFQSLWHDELFAWKVATLPDFARQVWQVLDNHTVGYHWILHLLGKVIQLDEFALRLPSAIAGTLGIYLIYCLGVAYCSRKAGLMSAALWAVSGAGIYYSQEAKSNSLMGLFALAHLLVADALVKRDRRTLSWVAWVATGVVCASLHFVGFCFVVLSSTLIALRLFRRKSKLEMNWVVLALIAIVCLSLPFLLVLTRNHRTLNLFRNHPLDANWFVYFHQMFDFGFRYESPWKGALHRIDALWFEIPALFGICAGFACQVKKNVAQKLRTRDDLAFLYAIYLITVTAIFLKDVVSVNRVFAERHFIFLVPLSYLILAIWVDEATLTFRNSISAVFLSLFLFQTHFNQNYYWEIQKTDYRKVSSFIQSNHAAPIVVACGKPEYFSYYLGSASIFIPKPPEQATLPAFWILRGECFGQEAPEGMTRVPAQYRWVETFRSVSDASADLYQR